MAMDRTNMGPEPIKKGPQGKSPVGMKLPRQDDGRVHAATGMRDNTSAAHFADAVDGLPGDSAMGPSVTQSSGR